MLGKILKLMEVIGLEKVEKKIDLFVLSGMVNDDYNINENKQGDIIGILSIITVLIGLMSMVLSNYTPMILAMIIYIIGWIFIINYKEDKSKKKYYKRIIRNKFKINIKDPKFIEFINKYMRYIKSKNLSNKEMTKLINNWKAEELFLKKDLRKENIRNKKEEINKLENSIKKSKKELKNLK